MKLTDLLKSLSKKGKLDLNKPEFIALFEAAKEIDVPDEFSDQLETALMNSDAAANNKEVISRVQAKILNGEDTYFQRIISEMEIDEESKNELISEQDTRAKIHKTVDALKTLQKKARKNNDSETEAALKTQVADLNKQLSTIKAEHEAKIKSLQIENDNQFVNSQLMGLLGAKQYSLPDKMPVAAKIKTALLNLQEAFAQKQLKVIKTDTGIKLVKADGTDPYNDKNVLLELPSFIDGVLADNGLLKNSDPTQGNNGFQPHSSHPNGSTNGGTAPVINNAMIRELDSIIDGLIVK